MGELDYIRTFISEVTTDLMVKTIESTGNIAIVPSAKKCLIVPGSVLSVDGDFYRKRYKIFLNMENEANLTTIMNQIIEGTQLYNKRDSTGKAEITLVTCLDKADITAESSFHFKVAAIKYYCWMKTAALDGDPTHVGETAIECDIRTDTTATQVAERIDNLIDAKGGVGCDNNASEILTITNAASGNVTDCYDDETTPTGFTITINDGGYTFPSTMCNIQFRYSNIAWFNAPNGRWSQTIFVDVEWCTT